MLHVCDTVEAVTVVRPLGQGESCAPCTAVVQTCTEWTEVPMVMGGSLPSAVDGALAFSAGFVLILAPWIIAWTGRTLARVLRAFH